MPIITNRMQFGVTRRDPASRIAKPLYASGESRVRIPPSPPGSKFECCTNVFAQDLSPIFRSALVRVTRCASQFFHCLAELSANRLSRCVGSVSRLGLPRPAEADTLNDRDLNAPEGGFVLSWILPFRRHCFIILNLQTKL